MNTDPAATPTGTQPSAGAAWLSVAQAAAALRKSERTIRRRCAAGELEARQSAGAWFVSASAVMRPSAANSAAIVSATADTDSSVDADTMAVTADTRPTAANSADAEIIADLRAQVNFLRASVEQHQRSEAELRAALRESLRAMPKQFTTGAPQETPMPTPPAPAPPKRDGAPLTYGEIADELERTLNR